MQSVKVIFLKLALILFCLGSLVFLVLCPLSYHFYTTLGIDTDRREGSVAVYYRYYRIRWPGDGSFRIGGGASHYRFGSKALEPLDFGGRFFQKPRRDSPHSFWNRIGFWRIQNIGDDQWTLQDTALKKPWDSWIGVPAFLPALLFAALVWIIPQGIKRTIASCNDLHLIE
jgi:hypothetical protein